MHLEISLLSNYIPPKYILMIACWLLFKTFVYEWLLSNIASSNKVRYFFYPLPPSPSLHFFSFFLLVFFFLNLPSQIRWQARFESLALISWFCWVLPADLLSQLEKGWSLLSSLVSLSLRWGPITIAPPHWWRYFQSCIRIKSANLFGLLRERER